MPEEKTTDYPFKLGLEDKTDITEGAFSTVKQFQNDKRWVVKEYDQVMDFAFGEWVAVASKDLNKAGKAPEMTFDRFREQVKRAEERIEKFGKGLKRFIPEHHLIFGMDDKGEKRGYVAMRRVQGEDVEKMKVVPPELVKQLEELLEESVKFYVQSNAEPISRGWFPDLLPIQDDGEVRFGNLMWGTVGEKKGLFLIDTYPLRHFNDRGRLALDLELMMHAFELEKGAKFSEGFVKKLVHEVLTYG